MYVYNLCMCIMFAFRYPMLIHYYMVRNSYKYYCVATNIILYATFEFLHNLIITYIAMHAMYTYNYKQSLIYRHADYIIIIIATVIMHIAVLTLH